MKNRFLVLLLPFIVSFQLLGKAGVTVKNETGEVINVTIDHGVDNDWIKIPKDGKKFLGTKILGIGIKRAVYWKDSKHSYTTPEYQNPDIITIRQKGNYDMIEKVLGIPTKKHLGKTAKEEPIKDGMVRKEFSNVGIIPGFTVYNKTKAIIKVPFGRRRLIGVRPGKKHFFKSKSMVKRPFYWTEGGSPRYETPKYQLPYKVTVYPKGVYDLMEKSKAYRKQKARPNMEREERLRERRQEMSFD